MMFADRREAGRRLADHLRRWRGRHPIVLGVPRGGVPLAYEVADALDTQLDVVVAHKFSVPFQPEVAMGAVAEGGVSSLSHAVVRACDTTRQEVAAARDHAITEVAQRTSLYRHGRQRLSVAGHSVIVVDDGIVTGATAQAACEAARGQGAIRVALAVPVVAHGVMRLLRPEVDELVALTVPDQVESVGAWYAGFHEVTDEEVGILLDSADSRWTGPADVADLPRTIGPPSTDTGEWTLRIQDIELAGRWTLPDRAINMVILPYTSNNARHGTRGRSMAEELNKAGYGTVLVDLLTSDEERDRHSVFDIALLAHRLRGVTRLIRDRVDANVRWLGCCGTGTAAAAAVWVAAEPDSQIAAVVCHNGRPDLAGPRLPDLTAPTLLLVGTPDKVLLDANRQAQTHLRCPNQLRLTPGATEQLGYATAQTIVNELTRDWFDVWSNTRAVSHHDRQHGGS